MWQIYQLEDLEANGSGGTQGESPLFIVDGVQRSFTQLDPNEIEEYYHFKRCFCRSIWG